MTNDSEETETVVESTAEEEKKPDTNKNKKNKKNKKNTPEPTENISVTLPYKPKGEMFAVAETLKEGKSIKLISKIVKKKWGRNQESLKKKIGVEKKD